ncbi:MAG: SpoIIE family protein phosphatase [Candidatus Dadabacteria bacterium]|nr:SpoIIE family protein phosphatase [Candidatus Dadabacteria bacterium]
MDIPLTDGVTEAMDIHENLFSDERLMNLLEDQKHHGPEESLRKTLNELKNFSSGAPQADDITLLALKYRNNG